MRELLLDVIRHVGSVVDFEYAKFTVTEEGTSFEAMDDDRTIILKGQAKQNVPELIGQFGMQRFPILQGFLNFANYRTDTATIKVKRKALEEGSAPEELVFADGNGQKSIYRFMSADLVPEQGRFVGTEWEVDIVPSRSKMQEFMQLAGILSSYEKYFLVAVQQGSLRFFIGDEDATTDRTSVTIKDDIEGELKGGMYWDSTMVSTILKLGLDENLKLKLTNKGAMMISMETPLAEYDFILPTRYK